MNKKDDYKKAAEKAVKEEIKKHGMPNNKRPCLCGSGQAWDECDKNMSNCE